MSLSHRNEAFVYITTGPERLSPKDKEGKIGQLYSVIYAWSFSLSLTP